MLSHHQGQSLSWDLNAGVIELALHREPCNEIGSLLLDELEQFVHALEHLQSEAHALILYSTLGRDFARERTFANCTTVRRRWRRKMRWQGVRDFLQRIHHVMNTIDAAPLTTIAAVHGVTFGGGFELALVCDIIIADKMARFCFPELRLGLIPGFGGIPRLKRDLGNGVVRDLLLTGRSFNAARRSR